MLKCGLMCKGCTPGRCLEAPNEEEYAEFECPVCLGSSEIRKASGELVKCEACEYGRFKVTQCYQDYVRAYISACNLASLVDTSSTWPVAGGVLDQAAWFVDFQQQFASEIARIDNDRSRRNGT